MTLSATALVTLAQAKTYLKLDPASSLHVDAEYVGVGDDTGELHFNLDHTPISGSLKLYLNNSLLTETTHFSITGAAITFVVYPPSGQAITEAYDYAAGDDTFESYDDLNLEMLIETATEAAEAYCAKAFIQRTVTETHVGDGLRVLMLYRRPVVSITSVSYEHIDAFAGDGATVAFTLADTPMAGSYSVYLAGVLKTETTHYSISGTTLTMVTAPGDGVQLTVRYNIALDLIDDYTEQLSAGRLIAGAWASGIEYEVIYTAGYAATRAATVALVPKAQSAVLVAIANWYENRLGLKSQNVSGVGSADYGEVGELPPLSKKLLQSLRVGSL